jgi:DNA invertase Pin-like site-specific DNA recombinase
MIYAYIRVSTDKQTVENQRFAIEQYAQREGSSIGKWVEEVVSGTKTADERLLGGLLDDLKKGDTLIVSELSRIGRSILDVFTTFEVIKRKQITLIGIKEGFNSGQKMSKIMLTLSAMFAEMERDRISERTKEALAKRKADGVVLGRRKGFKIDVINRKLGRHRDEIAAMMAKGKLNISQVCRDFGVTRKTVYRYVADIKKGAA